MGNLGMMVMLRHLRGNEESVAAFQKGIGQEIRSVELVDNELRFRFADGYQMKLVDKGQTCCENRYMRTDDNLEEFVGAKLLGGATESTAPAPEGEDGDEHEIQLLVIETSKGNFVMSNHNEHNGYYGGFSIEAEAL